MHSKQLEYGEVEDRHRGQLKVESYSVQKKNVIQRAFNAGQSKTHETKLTPVMRLQGEGI